MGEEDVMKEASKSLHGTKDTQGVHNADSSCITLLSK